jgi:hypothetical protein
MEVLAAIAGPDLGGRHGGVDPRWALWRHDHWVWDAGADRPQTSLPTRRPVFKQRPIGSECGQRASGPARGEGPKGGADHYRWDRGP